MNRDRLEHTAREVLPYVKDEKFDMTIWKCNTAACAFGHECLSEFGRKEGLTIQNLRPYFEDQVGYDAVAAYYDIPFNCARWAFSCLSYEDVHSIAPVDVAERIETLLACDA